MDDRVERFIYVLMLRDYKFYIGQSSDPTKRIEKQYKGKGSAWTRLYYPVETVLLKSIGKLTYKEAEIYENKLTLKYMKKYGWKNVRGGYFTNCDNEIVFKNLLNQKKRNELLIDFI